MLYIMMEEAGPCRICLAKNAQKNVSDLQHKGSNKTWSEIMLFCLDIKITDNTKESTKLCIKCYKKILMFYAFKLQAQKNDSILKKNKVDLAKVEHELFLSHEVKNEDGCDDNFECFSNEGSTDSEVKLELETEEDDKGDADGEVVIQNIKYEYVPEEQFEQTKENEPIENGKAKNKKKVSKDMDPNWVPPGASSVSKGKVSKRKVSKRKICGECGKSVVNLKDHMQLHKPANLRQNFPCKMCEKSFTTDSGRKLHTRIKHLGIKPHCKICNKAVTSLRSHTLMKHETSQLRFVCASCGRRFISQSSLDAHTLMHTGDRSFSCEQCDKKFLTKSKMTEHIRSKHNQEKSFLCQYCSKSFFAKRTLQIHIRTHTKEKPYDCAECGKFFATAWAVKAHRAVHSDSKEYSCKFCSKTFAHPRYLSNHMLTHTREKKYPCKYCGRKFHRSDHRKVHEFTAHEKHMIPST